MSQGKTTKFWHVRQTLNSPQRPQVQPKPLPRSRLHGAWRTPRQQRDRRPRKETHRKTIFQNNLWISLNFFWKCRYWNHPIKTSLATIPAAKKQEAPLLIHSNHSFWYWTGDDSSAWNLWTKVLSKICHEHEAQFKDFQSTNCLQSLTNKLFCTISLCEDSPIVDHQLSIYFSWEAHLYPFYRITETTETVATGSSATCFSDAAAFGAALLGACYRQEGQQALKACIAFSREKISTGSRKWINYIMRVLFWKILKSQHSPSLWMP